MMREVWKILATAVLTSGVILLWVAILDVPVAGTPPPVCICPER